MKMNSRVVSVHFQANTGLSTIVVDNHGRVSKGLDKTARLKSAKVHARGKRPHAGVLKKYACS